MNKFRMYACSIFATVLLIKVLGKRLRRRLDIKIASVPLPNSLYKQHTPSNSRAKNSRKSSHFEILTGGKGPPKRSDNSRKIKI